MYYTMLYRVIYVLYNVIQGTGHVIPGLQSQRGESYIELYMYYTMLYTGRVIPGLQSRRGESYIELYTYYTMLYRVIYVLYNVTHRTCHTRPPVPTR